MTSHTPAENSTDAGLPVPEGNGKGSPVGGETRLPQDGVRPVKLKVKKQGMFAAVFQPIAVALAVVLVAWGGITLGTNYWRSYQRHIEHTKATHPDKSIFEILVESSVPKLPDDHVKLVVRDVDGKTRQVVAAKDSATKFVNETLLMLEDERDKIKAAAARDIDEVFAFGFADREAAIDKYADWFFEWKRSYVILKESIQSTITRLVKAGEYESLKEAVGRDVKEYFMRHYKEQVLKPEQRDQKITRGLEVLVRRAHEDYKRAIANGDMRLQLFLSRHTRHLADIPASGNMTRTDLDWDAQKWKAPTYLMEDRAFSGIAGLGSAAAGGTLGAVVLGPVMNRAMASTFGLLSRRFVASMGTRIALAEQGAVAGTFIEPLGGQIVGAAVGIVLGVAADYFMNKASEEFNRDKFIAANNEALDLTVNSWRDKLKDSVNSAVDRWFNDARTGVILNGVKGIKVDAPTT